MIKAVLVLPFVLMTLTSCSIADNMNRLVNESTYSIQANQAAIAKSNEVIAENARLIAESTKTIEENNKHLETLSK